ncbi:preprotein translocase subunit SecG [cyanobacterium endosymbiont of Rhopalodia gibberula]|uniref:preprotein translocase subunit SecG n=1 Tax=cyanobacterium endosymbiont of Rhopalodia gibberula TaxID=1763363 RepID=UPI000DC732D0|nr:preprotein translocase subunit SecG [cyanobacterium endosymbiont of Rhopalodia gibberula]BBA79857.1 preprotein translocase subunit SecG [cyanobacterium endosymbiont of Rhopalodia gibberula]
MTLRQLLQVIWVVSAALLIVSVLLHSPKGDGIGGIGGQAQLFTSAKSAEKTLNQITWTLSTVFIALTIVLSAGWLNPSP